MENEIIIQQYNDKLTFPQLQSFPVFRFYCVGVATVLLKAFRLLCSPVVYQSSEEIMISKHAHFASAKIRAVEFADMKEFIYSQPILWGHSPVV